MAHVGCEYADDFSVVFVRKTILVYMEGHDLSLEPFLEVVRMQPEKT